jgi:EAL domain-containing protein (putative c-di-GMP-specific phosphodiesterase class I)
MVFEVVSIKQSEPARMGPLNGASAPVEILFQAQRELKSKELVAFQGVGHWNDVLSSWLLPPTDEHSPTQKALERAINLALATHCARAATKWRSQGFNTDVWITLNAQALLDAKFSAELLTCVMLEQAEPDWLVLEVEEAALAAAGEIAISTLEALSGLGFKIALCATGTCIFAFDKRMRTLFSHLKYDGSSAKSITRDVMSKDGRAFVRRMQAVRVAGIPVIVTAIESKDRKSAYELIGFTRFQSGPRAKAMTFETATKRLDAQFIGARIENPVLPQSPLIPELRNQSVEDALIESLKQSHQSMVRLMSLENIPKAGIASHKAA